MRAATSRRHSPLALFLVICGILIAVLFVLALHDLTQDGDKPPSFRSNDLTSAITSAAMLGLVAFAYLKVRQPGTDAAVPRADGRDDASTLEASNRAAEPPPARTPPGRRRRRRR